MINDPLHRYFENRLKKKHEVVDLPQAFVTISREYGCPANPVAEKLVEKINAYLKNKGKSTEWTWVNKQIIEKSAHDLEVNEERIEAVAHSESQSVMSELLESLAGKYYPNDIKIRNTIRDIIRSFAVKGTMVIVGRGGVHITSDLEKGIHIRLQAPVEWRVQEVIRDHNLNKEEALKLIQEKDKKREVFRESFKQKKEEETHFDITLNCSNLGVEEMSELAFCLLRGKGLLA